MTKEKEILSYMEKLEISKEEAEQLWEDDHSNEILPEVAEIEEKAKELKRHFEKSEKKTRKPSTRERKVDENKKVLLAEILKALQPISTNHEIKTETEISFSYMEERYTVKLTKHRKPKGA